MGQEDGEEAERHAGRDEGHEQADAHEDLGDDERRVDQRVVDALQPARAVAVEGVGGRGPQDDRHGRDRDGDDQRRPQGLPDLGRPEEPFVPDEGEALPAAGEAGGIEGVDDQEQDGQVEEDHDERRDRDGEAAPPHGASPMTMSDFSVLALEGQDGDERGEHGQDEDGREGRRRGAGCGR